MFLQNWFLPHKDTHKKAHFLSWEGLVIYILIFILLQVSFSIIGFTKPGVLGINASLNSKTLIELTNIERQKLGLSRVSENEALDKAAALKAQNMFAENYWAHFAPSGKTPWDFISGAGYRFTYAGENLAKNFYNSDEVVRAWMNSPTHRDNLLSSKYRDIGIAVAEGVLNGQKTTLVVQMFGTSQNVAVQPTVEVQGKQIAVPKQDLVKPAIVLAQTQTKTSPKALIDPYVVSKWAGFSVILFIAILLAIDVWMLKKRGVFRLSSHHFAHMSLLSLAAGSLWLASPGAVLGDSIPGPNLIPFPVEKMVLDYFSNTSLTIVTAGITIYLIWALIHHRRDKSLTLPILLEYLLTAALVLILTFGVIF